MYLLIVESPSKAKTIGKYLGGKVEVMASGGHIKDLPEREMGVDVQHGFEPTYVLIPNERKRGNRERVEMLRRSARKAGEIYLATDPDREGEMIAQHLKEEIGYPGLKGKIYRLTFHEITRTAIEKAMHSPGQIDEHLVTAQKARRVIDRLLGYSLSPWLSEQLGTRGLSAGRVQSVVLRFVVDRFREIQAFQSVPYWTIEGVFVTPRGDEIEARLHSIAGWVIKTSDFENVREGEIHLKVEDDARKVIQKLEMVKEWWIGKKEVKEKLVSAPPPLTTSTMQQIAAKKLGLTVQETMALAQNLYEGVDLPEGRVGLITYLRTDSTRLADQAVDEIRAFISESYGEQYLAKRPPVHRGQKGAQEAHEAIRPTSIERHPHMLVNHLPDKLLGLYLLIWQRAVASQMSPARMELTSIEIHDGNRFLFRAAGTVMLFPGYRRVESDLSDLLMRVHQPEQEPGRTEGKGRKVELPETEDSGNEKNDEKNEIEGGKGDGTEDEKGRLLPEVFPGEPVEAGKFQLHKHQTMPPRLYNEATLVKKMESAGIGRPSTYAQVIQTLQARKYMVRKRAGFEPTPLGCQVVDLLIDMLPDVFCAEYTARMESGLDEIAEGKKNWQLLVSDFYRHLLEQMKKVPSLQRNRSGKKENTEDERDAAGKKPGSNLGTGRKIDNQEAGGWQAKTRNDMKGERNGKKSTNWSRKWTGEKKGEAVPPKKTGVQVMKDGSANNPPVCPECGGEMQMRKSAWGPFWGCRAYPQCRGTRRIHSENG